MIIFIDYLAQRIYIQSVINAKLLRIFLTFIIFFGFFAKIQLEEDVTCSQTLEWQLANHSEKVEGDFSHSLFGHSCHFGHSCVFQHSSTFKINFLSKAKSLNNSYISSHYLNPTRNSIDKPPIS